LGPIFSAYSNIDSYTTPFASVLLSDIIQSSCPYLLNGVPDGTTIVRLRNISSNCCVDLTISGTIDLCDLCDLGFNLYSSTTLSVITVGNLTGSCENNITDYLINWYGPNSNTNVQFTSGVGNQFSYQWTHPLTGNSSVFVPSGVYIPEVESIILNGVELQENLGATSNCFTPITVEAYNCSNGTNPIDTSYSHVLEFTGSSSGLIPTILTSEFILSSTTNYFAYAFKAENVPDTLKITYSGSSYNVPLVIEYIQIGDGIPGSDSNFNENVFPKSADTQYFFNKVLCLTGLTYTNGDKLIIEVQPNQTNTTDWTLYFKCLETFDCDKCIDTKTPYKIIQSSITGVTGNCNNITISFKVSGCSQTENNQDVLNYMTGKGSNSSAMGFPEFDYNTPSGEITLSQSYYYNQTSCVSQFNNIQQINCYSDNNGYDIYYRSWRPNVNTRYIEIKFEDLNDFNAYVSSFYVQMAASGSTDPSSLDYYRQLYLRIPTNTGINGCGDNLPYNEYYLHPATVQFVTGTTIETPFLYTINITATTISDQADFGPCLLFCNQYVDNTVNGVNNTVTSLSLDFTGTTNVSLRYDFPFYTILSSSSSSTSMTSRTFSGNLFIPEYANITYVASGSPLVNIFNLSAQTCNFSTTMSGRTLNNFFMLDQYVYAYEVELTNPSDVRDFRIYASPITNGVYNGYPSFTIDYSDFVYGFSGGSVYHTNPTYLI
jgi:hypothetical protein